MTAEPLEHVHQQRQGHAVVLGDVPRTDRATSAPRQMDQCDQGVVGLLGQGQHSLTCLGLQPVHQDIAPVWYDSKCASPSILRAGNMLVGLELRQCRWNNLGLSAELRAVLGRCHCGRRPSQAPKSGRFTEDALRLRGAPMMPRLLGARTKARIWRPTSVATVSARASMAFRNRRPER